MPKRTESERFWAKVDRSGGPDACWPWSGFVADDGYCRFGVGRSSVGAHRYAYRAVNGAIPEGATVDHRCHNDDATCSGGAQCLHRRCCNPAHLEAVVQRVNVRRRFRVDAPEDAETCIAGHSLTGDNLYLRPDGRSICRTCARVARALHRETHPREPERERQKESYIPAARRKPGETRRYGPTDRGDMP